MSKHTGLRMSGIFFAAVFSLSLLGASIILMTPGSTTVEAREETAGPCRMVPVSLDEGYSISRIEMRKICGQDRS